jgi:hypothetical protein
VNWDRIVKAARESFREGVNEWISRATIQGGRVSGPDGEIPPGAFVSTVQFEPKIVQALTAAGAPPPVAAGLAGELWSAWKAWSDGFGVNLPGAFPKLAAVPGPVAPPSRGTPFALSKGYSAGESRLSSTVLAQNLLRALGPNVKTGMGSAGNAEARTLNWAYTLRRPATSSADMHQALQALADWVDSSFQEWKKLAQVVGVMGKGPIPSYAPPYVPVGPVVVGDIQGGGAFGALIAGPRFGKIVL